MSPMRILVISDTHGDLQALRMAFAAVQPDAVLHLGDCAGDLFYVIRDVLHDRPDFPFRAVAELHIQPLWEESEKRRMILTIYGTIE